MNQTASPGSISGLSEREAAVRLGQYGYNELPTAKRRSLFALAWELLREPMLLLLIGAGAVYLLLGDLEEALLLLASVFVVVGIDLYQERRTERALDALRDLSSPRALVIRDGEQRRVAGREVVPGDVLIVAEGDRVPADAVLLEGTNLTVDESLLTGESVPVRKLAGDGGSEQGRPGGDDSPVVYSGTLVVSGRGIARVRATGARTELGKIGKALQTVEVERTPLQRETGRLVRLLATLGTVLCVLVVVAYGLTRGNWLEGLLAGLTLAMSLVPEEFPIVLTVFLALGAWRIAQSRVLTRRTPAIETLGSATVLCVDKTGTLTLNRMAVSKLFAAGELREAGSEAPGPLAGPFGELVELAALASQTDPFDPMERAIMDLGERALPEATGARAGWTLVREYPLSPGRLAMSRVWQPPGGQACVVAAKGAPEAIADLCRLGGHEREELVGRVAAMAEDGLRVLGVARASNDRASLPGDQRGFAFRLLGLIGLADPVRPSVPAALEECYAAGIRVVMITGDYPGTATSIARQIGLTPSDAVISGIELERLDDAALRERIKSVNVFARVVPEQKLRLVNALKADGEVVAMTGDGVNDAPALKAAHIGIAMGGRGTDVAREAAALILLDDDFTSIVRAVRLGRQVFDNLRKAMAFLLAVHVPIAGLSLVPVLLGWPLVLLPAHVVFLEFIIDPACSLVFEAEPEESDVMRRPPRDPAEPLFSARMIVLSVLQGASVLVSALAVYAVSLHLGQGDLHARALAFTTLVIADLGLILANRSWSQAGLAMLGRPNRALWWVIGGTVAVLALVLYVPFLRDLFRFGPLGADDLLICLAAGAASVVWFEAPKLVGAGWAHPAQPTPSAPRRSGA